MEPNISSSCKFQEVIDQVSQEIKRAVKKLQLEQDPGSPVTQKQILDDLKTVLNAIDPLSRLDGCEKELNLSIRKYEKILEETLDPGISKAYRHVNFGKRIVDQIIRNHFYHEGLFDIADCFMKETGEPEPEALSIKMQFMEMHQILEALTSRNLEPALNWVSQNRERLKECGSDVELRLRRLQIMQIFQKRGRTYLLNNVKEYLSLVGLPMPEKQKLLGCLLWPDRLESSHYANLIAPNQWEKATEELKRMFCNVIIGQSMKSPLTVTLTAGIEAVPALLKLADEMSAEEWDEMRHLPVALELPDGFHFHSRFVCSVIPQATEKIPPFLMPCGHVISWESFCMLSEGSMHRASKCPLCHRLISTEKCIQLHL